MTWLEEKNGDHIINLRDIPRATKDAVQGLMGDALKIRIQAPPIEGKANLYLIKFIAKQWKIPRAQIEILSGETGRNKRVCIHAASAELKNALLALEPH